MGTGTGVERVGTVCRLKTAGIRFLDSNDDFSTSITESVG